MSWHATRTGFEQVERARDVFIRAIGRGQGVAGETFRHSFDGLALWFGQGVKLLCGKRIFSVCCHVVQMEKPDTPGR
jgi:hypothetical protein